MKIEGVELNVGDPVLVKMPVYRKKYYLFGPMIYTKKLKTEVYKITTSDLSSDATEE